MRPPVQGDSGLAVLVVIAATAVLAVIAAGTTLGAAAASGAAVYRAHELQADALARGALKDLEAAFARQEIGPPPVGSLLRSVNGAGLAGAPGRVPTPGSWWPPVGVAFEPSADTTGVILEIERVVGPDGGGRGLTGETDPDLLLRVQVEAWFRSGRVRRHATFVLVPGGVRRLR